MILLISDDYGKSLEYGISGNKIRLYNTMLGTGIGGEAAFTLEPNADRLSVVEAISFCATDPSKEIKYYKVTGAEGVEGGADDMEYICFGFENTLIPEDGKWIL